MYGCAAFICCLGGDGEISMTAILTLGAGARPSSLSLRAQLLTIKAASWRLDDIPAKTTGRTPRNRTDWWCPPVRRAAIAGSITQLRQRRVPNTGALPRVWSSDVIRVFEDVASGGTTVVSCVDATLPVRSAATGRSNRLGRARDRNVSLILIVWREVDLSNLGGACLI
jgi:hypothetical protein